MKRKAPAQRFQYAGWDVAIQLDATSIDGSFAGHAELSYAGRHKCRIALPEPHTHDDGASALDVLANEARAFIDDWQRRFPNLHASRDRR